MSLSFSMLNRNDGVGSGNQEWRVNCDTKSVKHGSRVLVLVEKKGGEGIASGTVALAELTTSKKTFYKRRRKQEPASDFQRLERSAWLKFY